MIGLPVIKVEGSKINILILLSKKECSLCNLAEDMVLKNIKENDWSLKKVDIENDLNLISSFSVKLSDFNIKIPKVVFMKIDEVVKINLNYNYELQN